MKKSSIRTAEAVSVAKKTIGTQVQSSTNHLWEGNWSWIRRISRIALTGLSLSALISGKAKAISFTFEKVVDTNTPIPGGTGNFEIFGFTPPSLDNGNVAFGGSGSGQSGIYTNIGGELNAIADENTPIAGGIGTFKFFEPPSLNNGNVAFEGGSGLWYDPDLAGIYTNIGGGLNVVADTNTSIPGGMGTFKNFGPPSLDNGNVAFGGGSTSSSQSGIYTNIGGQLDVVADKNILALSSTELEIFGASLDDGNVAFAVIDYASDQSGIYTNIGGELNSIFDENTSIPGGTGTFKYFGPPSLDNGNVVFEGSSASSDQNGIYTNIGGELNVIADGNTLIPGGRGTFKYFNAPSLDSGNAVFGGSGDLDTGGIYTNIGGTLVKVIAPGDLLDGREVNNFFWSGPESLSENQIAFVVQFRGNSEAIYVATAVPEPSSVLGTLAFGTFGAVWMLKRKLKK